LATWLHPEPSRGLTALPSFPTLILRGPSSMEREREKWKRSERKGRKGDGGEKVRKTR